MPEPIERAREYLQADDCSFWRWQDEGSVITWNSGTTIAFMPEVREVVERLAARGLPPFGAVVLALALCRDPAGATQWLNFRRKSSDEAKIAERLQAWRRVPDAQRLPLAAKLELIEALFESARTRLLFADSELIAKGLKLLPPQELVPLRTPSRGSRVSAQAFHAFDEVLLDFDPSTWEPRRRTGLEEVPAEAEVETPTSLRVQELLQELLQDQELSGLARLARNLLAAVYVPRPISSRDDVPVGGVSDLSNRGSLDRLLLSELAHDDLTLAVRVALNEALYLRRETPPINPPGRRFLLMDNGLRLWGVPRVFAMAVTLALAANTDKASAIRAFLPADDELLPFDLTTREGLLKALEILSTTMHPGAVLPPFIEQLEQSGEAAGEAADALLVTSDEAFEDHDFQSSLAELSRPILVATVNREGDYRLWAVTRRERKSLARARLSLADVDQQPRTLIAENVDPDLPVLLSMPRLPLLLPHPRPEPSRMRYSSRHGLLTATTDGRLMLWQKVGWAAAQLTDRLPGRTILWLGFTETAAYALSGPSNTHPARLTRCELVEGTEIQQLEIPQLRRQPKGVSQDHGRLLIIDGENLYSLDLESASCVHAGTISRDFEWEFHNFFKLKGKSRWFGFSTNDCELFDLPLKLEPQHEPIALLFGSGPIVLTTNGELFSTEETMPTRLAVAGKLQLVAVSRDFQRAHVRSERMSYLIDAAKKTAVSSSNIPALLEPEIAQLFVDRSLRTHFSGVYRDTQGRLVLIGRKGHPVHVQLTPDGMSLVLSPQAAQPRTDAQIVRFQPALSPAGARYTLHSARGPDGSRIFLDSRGMLHLCPVDKSQAEVTLVLPGEGALAAMDSMGRMTGSAFFVGGIGTVPGSVFFRQIQQFMKGWS